MEAVANQTIYPAFDWYWAVLIVVTIFIGIMLLGFEIFVFPGFGAAGVVGLIFFFGGSVTSWLVLGPAWGALVTVGSCAFSTAMFILALKSPLVRNRMILKTAPEPGGGTESEDLTDLVGKSGEARSDLRPAGIAIIEDRRIDVVSDGDFIDKGETVVVTAIDGPRVVVARAG